MKPASRSNKLVAVACLISIVIVSIAFSQSRPALGNLPSQGSVAYQAPVGFTEQSPLPGARVWKGLDANASTIVLLEKQMKSVEMPPEDEQAYKERLSQQNIAHLLAGISNYKIASLEKTPLPNGVKVAFTGSYTNSRNETIRFEKWEYFQKTGYAQIGYSARDSKDFPNREQIAQLLKGFIPSGT
jgi:hypothetical protein